MTGIWLKDPQAVLDYSIDWSAWLAGDVISSSSWTADTGITIDSDSNNSTTTKVWLSGGSPRKRYQVTNTIVTSAGRTDERTITIIGADK